MALVAGHKVIRHESIIAPGLVAPYSIFVFIIVVTDRQSLQKGKHRLNVLT